MWTFAVVVAVIVMLLVALSYVAELMLAGEPNRTTPGYALLPGDIKIERGPVRFYVPLATSAVLAIVLTLLSFLFS